jgi:Uma2 family endonuclease
LGRHLEGRSDILESYDEALPLVVEVWSPSTGSYDIDAKLPAYQTRGDQEIWRVHPFERTVTVWRRQPDGTYQKTVHVEGSITVASLPGVTIELAELFEK